MIVRISCAVIATAMAVREGWKTRGLLKGLGIPAPTGQYTVGCVDLMHKLEGDNDGLLVRLFYPTTPEIQEGASYQYAKWSPNKRYIRGFLDFYQIKLPGLLSALANLLIGILIMYYEFLLIKLMTKVQGHCHVFLLNSDIKSIFLISYRSSYASL